MSGSALSVRSAGTTVVAQTVGRALTLVVVLASTAIVTRTVGATAYADWATVLSLVALFGVLLEPGIAPIVVRRLVQEPLSAPAPSSLAVVRIVLGALALAVVVAVAVAVRGGSVAVLAVVLGAQVVPRALVLNSAAWLQADHRLHRQTFLEALCAALGLALLAAAAAADAGIVVLALVGFTVPTVVLAGLMQRELRLTPSGSVSGVEDQRAKVRSILREVAPLAGALLLIALYTRIQVVPLNAAADSREVAEYLLAFQLIEQVIIVAVIVAGALLPLLAARIHDRPLLEGPDVQRALLAVTALGAVGSIALLIASDPLLSLLGGPELADGAARDLRLLAPMSTVIFPAVLVGYIHVAQGRGSRYLWINASALALNLAAHAAFTLTYGAEAAARISWATEAFVLAVALSPVLSRGRAGAVHYLTPLAAVAAVAALAEAFA